MSGIHDLGRNGNVDAGFAVGNGASIVDVISRDQLRAQAHSESTAGMSPEYFARPHEVAIITDDVRALCAAALATRA